MIKRIYLRNVGPFRGEHVVILGPGAFAVQARHEKDARRSIGLGKSFLLEAVVFAITGAWPKNRGDADGWVTRGEREGCVALFLEGGACVERVKKRGKAREARAKTPGTGMREAFNDDATRAMLEHLRFEHAGELGDTCYVRQKKSDAIFRADPSERLSIVSGWLGLSSAERADALAAERSSAMNARVESAIARRDVLRRQKAEAGELPEVDAGAIDRAIDIDRARIDAAAKARKALVEKGRAEELLARQEERVRCAKKLRAELAAIEGRPTDAELDAARSAVAEADHAHRDAIRVERAHAKTAEGAFDGACPVAGIACPAKDAINADRLTARRRHAKAAQALSVARAASVDAEAKVRALEVINVKARGLEQDAIRLDTEIAADVEACKAAFAVVKAARSAGGKTEEEIDADEACAREAIQTHELARRLREDETRRRRVLEVDLAEHEVEAERLIKEQRTLAAAGSCVRAAQRRVAERALVQIERGANEALAEVDLDLRLRARWEREGKDLAKQCEECGAPFPTSRKVKECERCGAPRGMHAVQRLDLVAGDSSGGLDDVAGVAWQHAAAAWLLRARESPWSTSMLDEPTAHLDQPTRHGLVRYLLATLRRGDVRQLILSSHAQETIEAFPRRIVITCAADGDRRIEVV